jgi:hypothetical protein
MSSAQNAEVQSAKKFRKRTFLEMQPYIVSYGALISLVSPLATIYQLGKLNPQIPLPLGRMITLSAAIFPIQTLMKTIQMDISTPIKEALNPWFAFAAVGILQGGVYGQANIYYSKKLGLNKEVNIKGLFRGAGFAAGRDTLSQGVPFMCSVLTRKYIFDKISPVDATSGPTALFINKWAPVLSTSIFATYLSQGFMNCQITMQTNPDLNHLSTLKTAWERNGIRLFYRGAEARVGLLLVVNILNELILKPAWEGIEVKEDNV